MVIDDQAAQALDQETIGPALAASPLMVMTHPVMWMNQPDHHLEIQMEIDRGRVGTDQIRGRDGEIAAAGDDLHRDQGVGGQVWGITTPAAISFESTCLSPQTMFATRATISITGSQRLAESRSASLLSHDDLLKGSCFFLHCKANKHHKT